MVEFKHILCPIDLSDSSARTLAYAAAFARWYDAHLTILHVAPTFDVLQVRAGAIGDAIQLVQPMTRDEVLDALRQTSEAAGVSPLAPTFDAVVGDPVQTIVDRAVSMPADLVVLGTHGRGGFARLILGSVTERVLHTAPCPVLTVPPHATGTAAAAVMFGHILCPMDFSPSALQAFGFATALARQVNGKVTVLQALEWLAEEEPRTQAYFNVSEYRRHLIDDAHARLTALIADEAREAADIQPLVVVGRAYRQILETASQTATDLIVMGAQGRGGAGLALFGSTTHQVVRAAACPVLTVRA